MRTALCIMALLLAGPAPVAAQDMPPCSTLEGASELLKQSQPEAARACAERASETDPSALSFLGWLWSRGIGGPKDENRGRALLIEAADKGSFGAALTLARFHGAGEGGFPRDPAKAHAYALAAAEAPGPQAGEAQWLVGQKLRSGDGIKTDLSAAYDWTSRSAENGFVPGMISRAVMLATGEGVEADERAARDWYLRAAESNHPLRFHALRGLGGMLLVGQGGPVDLPRAFAYLTLAREGGDQAAQVLLHAMDARFSPADRASAQAIIEEWKQKLAQD